MKKVIVDGNEACSLASYLFTEAAGIYPITPSSPMAEHMDKWSQSGKVNIFGDKVKIVEMQSEAGASGLVHGLLNGGVLTTTFTASQGLLLMIPNMYKMAGEMLPCVMHVAARSLSTHALSIFGDHQDIYSCRSTGFNFLASSNVEDANYLSAVAHLSAIDSSLPFLHFFDGFRTSHELQKISVLESDDIKDLINMDALNNFRLRALNPDKPKTYGTNQNDDIYFQATEARNVYYDKVPDIVNGYMQKINTITGKEYKPFNYYGSSNATKVIVAMGSVCETIKEVIDDLKLDIGLVEVHLYRPFSKKYFTDILPNTVKNIAVLDRTKEFGSAAPLYLDVCNILKDNDIKVVGGRYGLSSKNTTPACIKAIYDNMDSLKDDFTVGINDDVTHLSLDLPDYKINNNLEMLIYGYGSDGMVSASKSLIKLIGNNTEKYVQGYFQYDSKKSGGVTKCHLRFSDNKIRSTYYVESPSLIAVTKDTYMDMYDILNDIKDNGIFILNTTKTKEEIIEYLPNNVKNIIKDKNINFYIINAYELARKVGLGNKISTILETSILYLSNNNYSKYMEELKNEIKKRFALKGEEVINSNILAIDETLNYLNKVEINGEFEVKENPKYVDVYLAMRHRKGDELPVSAFMNMPNGEFEAATSRLEKRCISDIVPHWVSENCIKCNMCSFVCPHSVIRPFELSDEEYTNAPDYIKERCKDNFVIGISVKDCTGCGLCIKSCPSNALIANKLLDEEKEQEVFDWLVNNVSCKQTNLNNVKNTQFKMPKLEFNGACAGCGQPAYIKLLTQLFGDSMIIANATGCSSIYGASAPSMPYNVPWASSLFEDNAEYGFGYLMADKINKEKIISIMEEYDGFEEYINNYNNYEITKKVYDSIDFEKYPKLKPYKDYIKARSIWTIGGDGWAYDIGFSGIDHVIASNERAKILVLDTQVYSNTGGQSSKATPKGSIALFASGGKTTAKKDLASMMMSYKNAYVAQVSLAANPMQLIKTFKEANEYDGPAIIIAYAPCISHGIKGGMVNSLDMEKEAVKCGYFPIFRYNPLTGFKLDCNPDFDLYEEFLSKQTRYSALDKVNENYEDILKQNKEEAIKRYENYKKLEEQ